MQFLNCLSLAVEDVDAYRDRNQIVDKVAFMHSNVILDWTWRIMSFDVFIITQRQKKIYLYDVVAVSVWVKCTNKVLKPCHTA